MVVELEIIRPGDPRYDKIEIVRSEIDTLLAKADLSNSEALGVLAALMANAIIQTLPQFPCGLLEVMGGVVHDEIHHQMEPGDGVRH